MGLGGPNIMISKEYRNMNLFLRNGFECEGVWGFPVIKKQDIDLTNTELIAYSDISTRDEKNLHKGLQI